MMDKPVLKLPLPILIDDGIHKQNQHKKINCMVKTHLLFTLNSVLPKKRTLKATQQLQDCQSHLRSYQ